MEVDILQKINIALRRGVEGGRMVLLPGNPQENCSDLTCVNE